MKGRNVLAQPGACIKKRFDDLAQISHIFGELADAILEFNGAGDADLQPKIAQQAADIVLNGKGLLLK